MSMKWPGGLIRKTPVTPAGPYQDGAAPGMWTLAEASYWTKQGLWPIAGNAPPVLTDPYFPYVSLLLPGNGTNGAQNNTFLDSDASPITINRNGNTTQGSFSPYGNLWSVYLDGVGDYLDTTTSAAFDLGGGDFTVEGWYFWDGRLAAPHFFQFGTNVSNRWNVYRDSGAGGVFRLFAVNGFTTSTAVPANTWFHLAATKSGSTTRLFLNGAIIGSSSSTTYPSGNMQVTIGTQPYSPASDDYFAGFVSNFRVVKGTALYTATFTPPTAPLTAVSGTSLLTCGYNRFRDGSSNNFTVFVNGEAAINNFTPFSPTASYSAATLGGSGYFDGVGDYLKSNSSSGFAFGANDFTMEAWVYASNTSATQGVVSTRIDATAATDQAFFGLAGGQALYYAGSVIGGGTVVPRSWNHIACSRQGSTIRVFVNGTIVATGLDSITKTTTFGYIGAGGGDNSQLLLDGYICDARFVNGTAVYTANFTPPTAPLTAVTNTVMLCNFTNAGVVDASTENDLETAGNAQISTAQSKFGGSSIYFDGTGDYLTYPAKQTTTFWTGDFTVEMWVNFSNANGTDFYFFDNRNASQTLTWAFYREAANYITWYTGSSLISGTGGTISPNQWNHIAYTRSGTTGRLFLNGAQVASATDNTNYSVVSNLAYIGARYSLAEYINGYIDDLRITKGYARYTTNFTPPTSAFPTR